MTYLKRVAIIVITLASLALFSACSTTPSATELYFFYMEACPGCEGYRKAEEISGRLKGIIVSSPELHGGSYNIYDTPFAHELMQRVWMDKRPEDAPFNLPVLLVDGRPNYGYEAIEKIVVRIQAK